ncbi:protein-disulfide reductase DsbD family protein [Bdellovibrio sp. HCB274]|uniref:protein-disulfide reductase DsbD family protein n=1 Tax=Bdellovibrio sp. HCB274 TaxID=3394361 RepID=UPI0039B6854B
MKATLQNILIIVTFLLAGLSSWAQIPSSEKDPMLVETSVLPYEWSPGQGGTLNFKLKLPPGYHAYEDQFKVVIYEPDGFKVAPFKLDPITKWYDKFSKRERTGLVGEGTLSAHIEAPTRFLKKYDKMKLELTYQACTDQFCLFPFTKTLEVPIVTPMVEGAAQLQSPSETHTESSGSFFDSANFSKYLGSSMVAGLIFVFFAGIFTSFTPCIFPMIPITLAVLGNHSEQRSRLHNFLTSCVYVLGIATTYSLLGLAAASSGNVFGASLGNPYVLAVVCVIFLAMALSMYGLYDIQVPAFLRNRLGGKKHKQSIVGIYLTGLFAGIVASPCVGPVLVAILTYVASTKNMLFGFLFLFMYALGLGLIFIALGLSNQLVKSLPRSGPWMVWFKFILGTLMLSAFYYYLELLLPARWFDASLGIGLVILASIYGAFLPTKSGGTPMKHMQKGIMQAVLIVGIGYIVLSVFDLRPYIRGRVMADNSINKIQTMDWKHYSDEALNQAIKDGRPVIIDFWAEWCAACHELAENTFTDPRVRALSGNFVLLKFDATKDSAQLKELKKKYNIQGLPTVIFYNSKGVWIDGLTLTQFENAEKFLQRMEKASK